MKYSALIALFVATASLSYALAEDQASSGAADDSVECVARIAPVSSQDVKEYPLENEGSPRIKRVVVGTYQFTATKTGAGYMFMIFDRADRYTNGSSGLHILTPDNSGASLFINSRTDSLELKCKLKQ